MSNTLFPYVLLIAPTWSLFLCVVAALPNKTRLNSADIVTWGALPSLAIVFLPDMKLQLSTILLSSSLVLDSAGRVFLVLIAPLWLATAILARPRLRTDQSGSLAVLMLLTMTGLIGIALAGDAMLMYASTTVAGYALYGMLVYQQNRAAHGAGAVLVVLFVISDLLIFELLIILAQTWLGADFRELRFTFLMSDSQGFLVGLLILGFGVKIGILGFHYWLPVVLRSSAVEFRPALVAYIFGAGLLAAYRILSLGQFDAPTAAVWLNWLALATFFYAWLMGLLQADRNAVIGYAVVAIGAIWLAILGIFLDETSLWGPMSGKLAIAVIQSGFAIAALLLFRGVSVQSSPFSYRVAWLGLGILSAWLVTIAPMAIVTGISDSRVISLYWGIGAVAFLSGYSLFGRKMLTDDNEAENEHRETARAVRAQLPTKEPVIMVTASLIIAATVAALFNVTNWSLNEWRAVAIVSTIPMIVAAAWASLLRRFNWTPPVPPGDILSVIVALLGKTHSAVDRLTNISVSRWEIKAIPVLDDIWKTRLRSSMDRAEDVLRRWPTAILLAVFTGLIIAWAA